MNQVLLASYIVLWLVVIVVLVALFGLYHHFGQMYLSTREGRSTHGPRIGTQLKSAEGFDLVGGRVYLPPADIPALLVFASTACRVCEKFLPDLDAFAQDRASELEVVLICGGEAGAVRRWLNERVRLVRVIADPGERLAAQYNIGVVPYCVGVDDTGKVRTRGIINTRNGLEAMADRVVLAEPMAAPTGVRRHLQSSIPLVQKES